MIQVKHYTSAAEMINAAKAIHGRLFPPVRRRIPVPPVEVKILPAPVVEEPRPTLITDVDMTGISNARQYIAVVCKVNMLPHNFLYSKSRHMRDKRDALIFAIYNRFKSLSCSEIGRMVDKQPETVTNALRRSGVIEIRYSSAVKETKQVQYRVIEKCIRRDNKLGKFNIRINVKGRHIYGGTFHTLEEARAKRDELLSELRAAA